MLACSHLVIVFQLEGDLLMAEIEDLCKEIENTHERVQTILRLLKNKLQESADEEKSKCLSTNGSCHA